MTRTLRYGIALVLLLVIGGCGDTKAASCREYATQVDALIEAGDSEALSDFIEGSEEHVARLISEDPNRAQPCVESVLEAVFVAEFAELDDLFEQ